MDPDFTVLDNGYLAVTGDTIAAVGSGVAPWTAAQVIDARGAIVLPGLVNAHTHLAMTLMRGCADDVDLQGFLTIVWARERMLIRPDTVRLGARAAAAESLLAGVTTAADMYFFPEQTVVAAAELGLRVVTGPVLVDAVTVERRDFPAQLAAARSWLADRDAGLSLRHVLCPHSVYTLNEEQLRDIAALAGEFGALVHIHAAENAGELRLVSDRYRGRTPVQVLADTGLLGPHTVLAHAVHLSDTDLDLIAAAGAGTVHCPASNMKLSSGVARTPEILARAIPTGLGTDGAASSNDLDLFAAMRVAGLLHSLTSGPGALPAREIVALATRGGAATLGLSDRIGSLQAGKQADFIVLDIDSIAAHPAPDPYSAVVYAMGARTVRHVVVAGVPRVRDGQLPGVDVAALAQELAATADGRSAALNA